MAEQKKLVGERFTPDRNLKVFSETPIGRWVSVSAAVHVVVILLMSYAYVRSWVDPEWGAARKAALEKAESDRIKSEEDLKAGKAIQDERAAAQRAAAAAAASTNAAATNAAGRVVSPALSAQADLDKRIAEAFAKHGIDPKNPVVMERLKDIPRDRWVSEEILESVKVAKPEEVPEAPNRIGLDISLDDTK